MFFVSMRFSLGGAAELGELAWKCKRLPQNRHQCRHASARKAVLSLSFRKRALELASAFQPRARHVLLFERLAWLIVVW